MKKFLIEFDDEAKITEENIQHALQAYIEECELSIYFLNVIEQDN